VHGFNLQNSQDTKFQIVIASEAKQSISPLDAKKAGLLRFARNDGKTRIRIPAARFRPSLANHPPR
jgi:hypothetical protein